MTPFQIILDGDNAYPELKEGGFLPGQIVGVCRLPMGTGGGRSAIVFRIQLEDGSVVLAQTTLRLMESAMVAVRAREDMEAAASVPERLN